MLTPRWRKIFRDLTSNKTKTILVTLAIAVGVFAFGGTFITEDILVADMDKQYMAMNPSNIILSVEPYETGLLRWVERQPEVAQVQAQASHGIKLITGSETYNLTVIAYEDYSNIMVNKVTPEKGTWPPGKREITFERASLGITQAQIGDKVTLELSNGKRYELTIAGTAHDVSAFPANMFPMPTAYVSLATLDWMGLPGLSNQIDIVTTGQYKTQEELQKAATSLRERMRDRGISVYGTTVRSSEDHWAKEITQSFTLILGGIGFFSLILSGFLVINTITALLAQQRRQIGVMKAVGGTGGQIIRIYLVLVGFYGLLGLIVALPASLGLGYLFTKMVSDMLNFDILNFYLPTRVLLLEVAAALLVPIIASALPVLGVVKVPVRETLSNIGISGKGKSDIIDSLLMKIRILSRPVLLSLRNTFRRKARLALTLGTLTIAGTLFMGVMNVRAALITDTENMFKKYYDYEVSIYLDGSYPEQGIETRVMRTPGITEVECRTSASVELINDDGSKGTSFGIYGLPPDTVFMKPDLTSGRWLQTSDRNAIVLPSVLLEDMPGVKVGDSITLMLNNEKYNWEVVGIIPEMYDRSGYAPFDYLSRVKGTPGMASTMYIRTEAKDGQSQTEIAEAIENQLKKSGINVGGFMTRDTIASSLSSRNDFMISFLLIMAIMAAVIGGLALMGMMSLNVLERTREIGVMRSIGASTGSIGSIVAVEGLIIGAISWLLAIPLSVPVSIVFDTTLGEVMGGQAWSFVFSAIGVAGWLGIVLAIAVLASIIPALKAMRMSIRETLAYE